jgi:hypothetical protein
MAGEAPCGCCIDKSSLDKLVKEASQEGESQVQLVGSLPSADGSNDGNDDEQMFRLTTVRPGPNDDSKIVLKGGSVVFEFPEPTLVPLQRFAGRTEEVSLLLPGDPAARQYHCPTGST